LLSSPGHTHLGHDWLKRDNGFFIWDHILYSKSQRLPMVDPWIALSAIATSTKHIRIGTMITAW